MRRTYLQRTAALALASTCLSTQALAQNAGTETLPPVRQQLDENGVDVARGTQVNYSAELSIGPDDPGGLKLIRGRGPGGIELSNYSLKLSHNPTTASQATEVATLEVTSEGRHLEVWVFCGQLLGPDNDTFLRFHKGNNNHIHIKAA